MLVLANAFTVETGIGARVTTELIGPPLVRSGRIQPFYVVYRNEGAGDPIVITLPKGGYVPEFSERSSSA